MKTKELMISDWVITSNGKPMRYSGIFKHYEPLCESPYTRLRLMWNDNEGLDVAESDVNPLPLTEEILKANGFKKLDLTIGNYALKLEEKEKYDIHTILWGGVFNGRMEFKVICEYIHIDKKIRYVHELQHALRLCGLNELADNFKLEEER